MNDVNKPIKRQILEERLRKRYQIYVIYHNLTSNVIIQTGQMEKNIMQILIQEKQGGFITIR